MISRLLSAAAWARVIRTDPQYSRLLLSRRSHSDVVSCYFDFTRLRFDLNSRFVDLKSQV